MQHRLTSLLGNPVLITQMHWCWERQRRISMPHAILVTAFSSNHYFKPQIKIIFLK
ncbi:hypothetical protein KKH3_07090 [Pectobacterium actinidiae]|nr:hypothetical protein KKH3_07090 [Pectobacterium actinidiae]